jgi:hypothetical protein
MKEFLNNLTSAGWWIGVVIVGILINLVSAYIKSKLDSRLADASTWWQKRSLAQKEKRQKEIERLNDNPHEEVMLALAGLRDRIRCTLFILLGTLIGTLTVSSDIKIPFIKTMCLAASAIGISVGYMFLLSGISKEILLNEARKQKEGVNPERTAT